ncbi:hypothetical protein [Hydrogenophaga sp. 2FB]|uniref:hypothetical protein n=1 Tax=Hydrogenophaga sp. 2FB TaxID=2502187 RepID=UPI0010F486F4|nr:hypothetical protein [Hydrogenophaga sp. 2FB]
MAKGLLDFVSTPEGQGLLSAAFGGLAGARRGQPLNSIGRGGLAGLAGYAQAQDRVTQEQESATQRKYRDMQMQELERKGAQQVAQDKWRAGLPTLLEPKPVELDQFTGTTQLQSPSQEVVQKYLMDPASPFADKVLEQKLFPKQGEAFTLSPGQTRYGIDGRPVASVPEQQKRTSLEEMLDAAGIKDPAVRQRFILDGLKKQTSHAPAANTNVVLKQEGEEAKSVGKFFGDAYANMQNAGFSAQTKVNRYDRLGQLLDGVNTGKFAGAGLEVSKAANSLGFNLDPNMANKEAAQALSGEIALELRNPSGGAGMPGAMSDADRQFLVNMVPGLATTPDGRKLMLETAKKLAQRDMEVARLGREYRKRNGSIDEGFYDELTRYSTANPLFGQQSAPAPSANGFTIKRVR